ncbi:MAG: transketolase [Acidimicrobiia bacterium]|nr:transketolase [Acidimicrobiia bacterium]MDX2465911.1 transketolase [Acidimicrobiia bacterium]
MKKDIEQLAVDTIRTLSIDAIQKANSGHPGAPMGMADMAVVLWSKFLRVDPQNPTWENRDRFVLSAGHASMLLYSLLHMSGFSISIEDIKQFRQWGSATPGHPELDIAAGIELTTGPLGQGFATGVGMAIAETKLSARFGSDLINHHTYGFVSDGDLMEGVSSEAASLAGHLGLGKLIYLYDDNGITLVGPTRWSYSEDAPKRFEAYGWQTMTVDGHDRPAVADAIAAGLADESRPTLISCKTHIGFGSPSKQDSAAAHGSPLGVDEIALVKENMGWDYEPFHVPNEVYSFFTNALDDHRQEASEWQRVLEMQLASDETLASSWKKHFDAGPISIPVPEYEEGSKVATRAISGDVINGFADERPDVVGGSADLASSNNTLIKSSGNFSAHDRSGRNIRFGVREHAMGAIVNGITVHGGMRAYGGTFLTFSDYMRGSIRLGALMGIPSVWVFTHDSIFLGEDGPTHQSVEHVSSLRAIPNLWVVRPGNAAEVAGAWELALNRTDGPTALILTRQGVPTGDTASVPVAKGGYIVRDGSDAVLVATGSELGTALEAAEILQGDGKSVRVVSMPCVEAFKEQDEGYRADVLGDGLPRASVEAGVTYGWGDVIGDVGLAIGIDTYGASAPAGELAERFGLTGAKVADKLGAWLG